ncbi:MAG: DUF2975 domain-containing protein [Flavobacteriales bacterium]
MYTIFIIICGVAIIAFSIISLFKEKLIIPFLHKSFQFGFVFLISFLLFQISLEIFTNNGNIRLSNDSQISSTHSKDGYNVPVNFNISFDKKKVYTFKEDSISYSFTKYDDQFKNKYENSDYHKDILERIGITQKELDSIFKYSPDVKSFGSKILINEFDNQNLLTNSSSFKTDGYLQVKSSNWFYKICQILKNYLVFIFSILIFYYLKSIFKLLNKNINFSSKLSSKIKTLGILMIVWQIFSLILSIILGQYFKYAWLKNTVGLQDISIIINPRIEFNFTVFLIGISLIVLSILLKKGFNIQQENDLTI